MLGKMVKYVLVIVLAYVGFQVLGVVHKKYLPKGAIDSAVEKIVEVSHDTYDALTIVYEIHK
jgi:hypothetical protein